MNVTNQRELRSLTDIYNGSYNAYFNSGTGIYKLLGSADLINEDVIGVFFKQIAIYNKISAYHMYILCHNHLEQVQFIFRAGPSMDIEKTHAAVYFFTGATPPVRPDFVTYGYIKGEVGLNRQYELVDDKDKPGKKILIGSVDYDANGSNIGVIIKKGSNLQKEFDSFNNTNTLINRLNIRYNPRYPNSNSYVTSLLKKAGLPSAKESIDSYKALTENREYFTNLFTPGDSVIDITRADVIYDRRNSRVLIQELGPLASEADARNVGEKLTEDKSLTTTWPTDKYFYNEIDYNYRVEMNKKIKNLKMEDIYIPGIP